MDTWRSGGARPLLYCKAHPDEKGTESVAHKHRTCELELQGPSLEFGRLIHVIREWIMDYMRLRLRRKRLKISCR